MEFEDLRAGVLGALRLVVEGARSRVISMRMSTFIKVVAFILISGPRSLDAVRSASLREIVCGFTDRKPPQRLLNQLFKKYDELAEILREEAGGHAVIEEGKDGFRLKLRDVPKLRRILAERVRAPCGSKGRASREPNLERVYIEPAQ